MNQSPPSGNQQTYSRSYQSRFWFLPPLLFVGAMGGLAYFGYETYFEPKTTFYQTNQAPVVLKATVVESDEEKEVRKNFGIPAASEEVAQGTAIDPPTTTDDSVAMERIPATALLDAEIKMTQDNIGVTYEISVANAKPNDVKIVVSARMIELTAKDATTKEVKLPKGVDHTRAEITKKDGKWIVKLPRA